MVRILLVYYSQSGDAGRVTEALTAALQAPGVELVVERLRPRADYPFPWRSVGRFFSILPDCHLGPVPELEPLAFDATARFDLVMLIYQVWFLMPSLPVQGFFRTEAARVLRDTKVMTISVSRNMWQSASEAMKALLRQAGARHIDNAALTHRGPAWATFITTPRALLYGKKERFWRIFPPAGLGDEEIARAARFGEAVAAGQEKLRQPEPIALLSGLGAVRVNRRYLLPELAGWYAFRAWAHLLRWLGRWGSAARLAGVYAFVVSLVVSILVGVPVIVVGRLLLYPLMRRWTAGYVRRLGEPSGEGLTP
jgi:hypothetical protein